MTCRYADALRRAGILLCGLPYKAVNCGVAMQHDCWLLFSRRMHIGCMLRCVRHVAVTRHDLHAPLVIPVFNLTQAKVSMLQDLRAAFQQQDWQEASRLTTKLRYLTRTSEAVVDKM